MAKNPVVGERVVSPKRVQDLVLWEAEQRYTRTAVVLEGGEYKIGEVLVDAWPQSEDSAHGAQPTFTDAICLENVTIEDDSVSTREVAVLVRGPALVNMDEIERTSDAETDDQLRTRLADLLAQGVRFVREPAVREESDLWG